MIYSIPGELWNKVGVPSYDGTSKNISSFMSEIAYKIPSMTDVMMTKELWHTVCEFSERCGALRERITGNLSSDSMTIGTSGTYYGKFQRFVGAGADGQQTGFDRLSVVEDSNGPKMEFNASCLNGKSSVSAYVDVSVVPNLYAVPSSQVVPQWFLKMYERALTSGTLMRIYAMTGERWTDEAAARMHATTYLREINRVTHGLITGGMRRQMMFDAESILARQSQTSSTQTTSNTVG